MVRGWPDLCFGIPMAARSGRLYFHRLFSKCRHNRGRRLAAGLPWAWRTERLSRGLLRPPARGWELLSVSRRGLRRRQDRLSTLLRETELRLFSCAFPLSKHVLFKNSAKRLTTNQMLKLFWFARVWRNEVSILCRGGEEGGSDGPCVFRLLVNQEVETGVCLQGVDECRV